MYIYICTYIYIYRYIHIYIYVIRTAKCTAAECACDDYIYTYLYIYIYIYIYICMYIYIYIGATPSRPDAEFIESVKSLAKDERNTVFLLRFAPFFFFPLFRFRFVFFNCNPPIRKSGIGHVAVNEKGAGMVFKWFLDLPKQSPKCLNQTTWSQCSLTLTYALSLSISFSLSLSRSRSLSRSCSLSRSLSLSLSLGVQFARNKHGARVVSKGSMGPVLGQLRSHGRKRLLLSLGQGDVGESHGTSSVWIPDTPQHTATHCNRQQHTATHCNTNVFTYLHMCACVCAYTCGCMINRMS